LDKLIALGAHKDHGVRDSVFRIIMQLVDLVNQHGRRPGSGVSAIPVVSKNSNTNNNPKFPSHTNSVAHFFPEWIDEEKSEKILFFFFKNFFFFTCRIQEIRLAVLNGFPRKANSPSNFEALAGVLAALLRFKMKNFFFFFFRIFFFYLFIYYFFFLLSEQMGRTERIRIWF
jgi:hypothetical protein